MRIRQRLIVMNFLEFFIWGAWLISLGGYLGGTLGFSGTEIGAVFSTMGIASLFMPAVAGIIADRWMNAERVFGICHFIGAGMLLWSSTITDPDLFFWIMLLNSMVYMPTLALNNTISYTILRNKGLEPATRFPPIRVWGTVGFVAAMWTVDLSGWKSGNMQLLFSAVAAASLGLYALTLPGCPPPGTKKHASFLSTLGLDALVLFKQRRLAVFFIYSMLLGAALQITNAFGGSFLESFQGTHPDSFAVQHPILLLSVSQISETLFILAIPFFLTRFGIKTVIQISIVAWVLRFGLFAVGNPDTGLYLLILSMIIYGMAFDFFNISGSLLVEKESPPYILASAQGLFMLMTNGIGAMTGGYASGLVVDHFTHDGIRDWQNIWFTFAGYALILALTFPFVFRYRNTPVSSGFERTK